MRFDLKKPCKDCPFTKGNCFEQGLPRKRVQQIIDDISSDKTFPCHKHNDSSQQCAGATIMVQQENMPNQSLQIAERLGISKPKNLSGKDKIYSSINEMLNSYRDL